jgi:hypothetical protein
MHQKQAPQRRKVAIIGSGPYDTAKPMGKYIDSCDVVVRFNRFSTKGHEKYVGSKTTVWCYFANLWKESYHPIERVEEVWLVRQFGYPLHSHLQRDAKKRNARLWDIPQDWIASLRHILEHSFPSTGMVALYAAIHKYKVPIYTQGLGQLSLGKPFHYYNPRKIKHRVRHSGEAEAKLIKRWKAQSKLLPTIMLL